MDEIQDMNRDGELPNIGCDVCDWEGPVARSHDYRHRYYTHTVMVDGSVFRGKTCSMRTKPKRTGLLTKLKQLLL